MTLEELEEMLYALKAAKFSGVLRVKHGETETLYRSMAEIDKAIADLLAEIAALGTGTRSRIIYIRQRD
jgi:hypothetical protein